MITAIPTGTSNSGRIKINIVTRVGDSTGTKMKTGNLTSKTIIVTGSPTSLVAGNLTSKTAGRRIIASTIAIMAITHRTGIMIGTVPVTATSLSVPATK